MSRVLTGIRFLLARAGRVKEFRLVRRIPGYPMAMGQSPGSKS